MKSPSAPPDRGDSISHHTPVAQIVVSDFETAKNLDVPVWVAHKCCCGCGQEVVTPLSPTYWKLTFDGRSISLDPSIGNWSFPCKSHYWIRSGKVRWAGMWTHEQIEAGREADRTAKEKYFGADAAAPTEPKPKRPIWSRLKWW